MYKLNRIINWIVLSSKNSSKPSTTVLAGFTAIATGISIVWGLVYHVNPPNAELNAFVDTGLVFVQSITVVISTLVTFWAAGRKLWRTFKGTNEVINDPLALNQ